MKPIKYYVISLIVIVISVLFLSGIFYHRIKQGYLDTEQKINRYHLKSYILSTEIYEHLTNIQNQFNTEKKIPPINHTLVNKNIKDILELQKHYLGSRFQESLSKVDQRIINLNNILKNNQQIQNNKLYVNEIKNTLKDLQHFRSIHLSAETRMLNTLQNSKHLNIQHFIIISAIILLIGSLLSIKIFNLMKTHFIHYESSLNELQQTKNSLNLAQQIAHTGNWDWDIPQNQIKWSDEVSRILGISALTDHINYDNYINFIHTDDRDRYKKHLYQAMFENKPLDIEHRIIRSDGEIRYIYENGEVIHDDNTQPIRMLGTVQDITDMKISEIALLSIENKNPYRSMDSFLEECVIQLSKVYKSKYALIGVFADENKSIIQTLKISCDQLIVDNFQYSLTGTPCQDILDLKAESITSNLKERYPSDELLLSMNLDSYYGTPLVSPSQGIVGLVSVMDTKEMHLNNWTEPLLGIFATRIAFEIEQKRTSDSLFHEKEKAQITLNSIADAVITTDLYGKVESINKSAESITGWKNNDILGLPISWIFQTIDDSNRKPADNPITKCLAEGKIVKMNDQLKLIDRNRNEIYIESSASPIYNNYNEIIGAVLTFHDTSLRKQGEGVIRNLAVGVSALTGNQFFRTLVLYLGNTLKIDHVFIGKLTDPNTIETISVYSKGNDADNFSYSLENTPCNFALTKTTCCFPKNIQKIFPEDHLLSEMNIESYAGAPLFDSKDQPIGIIVVMDEREIYNPNLVESILQIFAVRVSAELERIKVEQTLINNENRLKKLNQILTKLASLKTRDCLDMHDIIMKSTEAATSGLNCQYSGVWFYNQNKTQLINSDIYSPVNGHDIHESVLEISNYPNYINLLSTERCIAIEYCMEDQRSAELIDSYIKPNNIFSSIEAPIRIEGNTRGVIRCECTNNIRQWATEEENFVGSLADLIALSIETCERRKVESERMRFFNAFEASINEIYIFNADNLLFQYVNSGALTNLGYSLPEMKQMTPIDIKPDYEMESFKAIIKPLTTGEKDQLIFQTRHQRKNGTVYPVEVYLQLVKQNTDEIYIAIIVDITDRTRSEEKLKLYTKQLEQSNRELESFAFVASHDLQEPLRKVQVFSDRLASTLKNQLDNLGHDYLTRIQSAAKRMQKLISDLLTFSRIATKSNPFIKVNLNQIINGILSDLEILINQVNGQIIIGPLPEINADPTQMYQLFLNLISNSLKYIKNETPPLIKISGHVIKTSTIDDNQIAEITVTDNGIGFDEKYLNRIFNVFQRLHNKKEYEGTGIGLAICRRITEHHQGTITAKSSPDKGATFIIQLPVNHFQFTEGNK